MNIKLQKSDYCFAIALLVGIAFYFLLLFQIPFINDEDFFPIIPLRLINGESLVQHEWHLTQFSSLFQYIPVKLWLSFKGSTDGIILFFRCSYLFVHSIFAILIYKFFRKAEFWAVAASMIFFTCLPYGMFVLSYVSMLILFLLLFTLSLMTIYKKGANSLFIFAGLFFGCCCICNPILCVMFFLYVILYILWPYKEKIISAASIHKTKNKKVVHKKVTKKKANPSIMDSYGVFFTKTALKYSCCGLGIIALIAIIFFFSTGGTISSVFENVSNMLKTSEYNSTSYIPFNKIQRLFDSYKTISLNLPFFLPIFFLSVFFDKKRMAHSHRLTYLFIAFCLSIVYIIGIPLSYNIDSFMFAFPFAVFSTTCYILTENKNKTLFYCMWVPCAFVSLVQLSFSNTILLSFGVVLIINNIAGTFFVRDLYKELSSSKTDNKKTTAIGYILLITICTQLIFQCCTDTIGKFPMKDTSQISVGPYSGLYMKEDDLVFYNETMKDIETIKSITYNDDHIMIFSDSPWPYICIERPIAANTTWLNWKIYPDDLKLYYQENPEKTPVYIYLTFKSDFDYELIFSKLVDMFDFTQETLSNGILLKVEKYKL